MNKKKAWGVKTLQSQSAFLRVNIRWFLVETRLHGIHVDENLKDWIEKVDKIITALSIKEHVEIVNSILYKEYINLLTQLGMRKRVKR